MSFDMLRITKLAAANVTFELSDYGMLRHVNTHAHIRFKSFTANLTQVRIAYSVNVFIRSKVIQAGIARMTL